MRRRRLHPGGRDRIRARATPAGRWADRAMRTWAWMALSVSRRHIHEPGGREDHRPPLRRLRRRRRRCSVLHDLAADPRTARRISRKLAIQPASSSPTIRFEALVDRLSDAWIKSGGKSTSSRVLWSRLAEAWDPEARQFKTPYERWSSPGYRAAGVQPTKIEHLRVLTALGQKPFSPPPRPRVGPTRPPIGRAPTGSSSVWSGPRVSPPWSGPRWSILVATAKSSLGARLSDSTEIAIARAGEPTRSARPSPHAIAGVPASMTHSLNAFRMNRRALLGGMASVSSAVRPGRAAFASRKRPARSWW